MSASVDIRHEPLSVRRAAWAIAASLPQDERGWRQLSASVWTDIGPDDQTRAHALLEPDLVVDGQGRMYLRGPLRRSVHRDIRRSDDPLFAVLIARLRSRDIPPDDGTVASHLRHEGVAFFYDTYVNEPKAARRFLAALAESLLVRDESALDWLVSLAGDQPLLLDKRDDLSELYRALRARTLGDQTKATQALVRLGNEATDPSVSLVARAALLTFDLDRKNTDLHRASLRAASLADDPLGRLGQRIVDRDEGIDRLAQHFVDRMRRRDPSAGPTVLVLGDGANIASGFPSLARVQALFVEILRRHDVHPPVYEDPSTTLRELIELGSLNRSQRESIHDEMLQVLRSLYRMGAREGSDETATITPPHLVYELVAHLVRHRAVDHVVCLNWDDNLDAALVAEVEPGTFSHVYNEVTLWSATESPQRERSAGQSFVVRPRGSILDGYSMGMFGTGGSSGLRDRQASQLIRFIENEILPADPSGEGAAATVVVVGSSMTYAPIREVISGAAVQSVFRLDAEGITHPASQGTAPIGTSETALRTVEGAGGLERVIDAMARLNPDLRPSERALRHRMICEVFRPHIVRQSAIPVRDVLTFELLLAGARTGGDLSIDYLDGRRRLRPHRHVGRKLLQELAADARIFSDETDRYRISAERIRIQGENAWSRARGELRALMSRAGVSSQSAVNQVLGWYELVRSDESVEVSRLDATKADWEFLSPSALSSLEEMRSATELMTSSADARMLCVATERSEFLTKSKHIEKGLKARDRQGGKMRLELLMVREDPASDWSDEALRSELSSVGFQLADDPLLSAEEYCMEEGLAGSAYLQTLPVPPAIMRVERELFQRNLTVALRSVADGGRSDEQATAGLVFEKRDLGTPVHPVVVSGEDAGSLYRRYRAQRRLWIRGRTTVRRLDPLWTDRIDDVIESSLGRSGRRHEFRAEIDAAIGSLRGRYLGVFWTPGGAEEEHDEALFKAPLIGVVSYRKDPSDSTGSVDLDLSTVAVARTWQGRGVGRRLVDEMIARTVTEVFESSTAPSDDAVVTVRVDPMHRENLNFLLGVGFLEVDPVEARHLELSVPLATPGRRQGPL